MELLEPITRDIIIGIVLAGGLGLVAFVKKKLNKIDALCNRIINLEKAVQVLTKIIAIQTKRSHPEDAKEVEDLIELMDIMMKDDD